MSRGPLVTPLIQVFAPPTSALPHVSKQSLILEKQAGCKQRANDASFFNFILFETDISLESPGWRIHNWKTVIVELFHCCWQRNGSLCRNKKTLLSLLPAIRSALCVCECVCAGVVCLCVYLIYSAAWLWWGHSGSGRDEESGKQQQSLNNEFWLGDSCLPGPTQL